MTITKNGELINLNCWVGKKYNVIREAPSRYYNFVVILPTYEDNIREASDEEFLKLPIETGAFSFLEDASEDIYTESDGTKIA